MEPTDRVNPYEAPRAELDAPTAAAHGANVEDALAGRYSFTVSEVMNEAWRLVKGMKGTFWGAAIVLGIIFIVFQALCGVLFVAVISKITDSWIVKQVFNGLMGALMTPFLIGMQMMCVRRALGEPISFSMAFGYFSRAGTAIAAGLLTTLLTYAGLAALIIPGIYLAIAYSLTYTIVGDQEVTAWKAMETSRRAISHRWWDVFGLGLLVGLLTGVSALGLLIPLIWTIPWAMMTTAVLYRRMFYAPRAAVDAAAPPAASAGPPPVPPPTP